MDCLNNTNRWYTIATTSNNLMENKMKKFFNSLSQTCTITLTALVLAFLILPIKIVIVLAIAYAIAHATGAFKIQFPDIWDLEENSEDSEKSHRTFLTIPTRINGTVYVFCYVHRVIIDGVTSYSFSPIQDASEDATDNGETIN